MRFFLGKMKRKSFFKKGKNNFSQKTNSYALKEIKEIFHPHFLMLTRFIVFSCPKTHNVFIIDYFLILQCDIKWKARQAKNNL